MIRNRFRGLALLRGLMLCLAIAAAIAPAGAAPPPLIQPDLSTLPATQQAALRELRGEFDRNIGALTGEDRAVAYLQMGALYLRSGLAEAGNIALDHAVAAQPEDPRFVYLRGVAALRQKDATGAAAALAKSIRLDGNYLPAHYHLAEIQIAENNLAGARATLAPLLAKRQDIAPAVALMGEIALREKRYDEAIAQFNRALKLEPQASVLHERLAAAHAGRGDAAAAAASNALAGDGVPTIADPLAAQLDGPGANSDSSSARPAPADNKLRETLEAKVRAQPQDLDARLALIEWLALAGDGAGARAQLALAEKQLPGGAKVTLAQAMVAEAAGDEAAARAAYARAVAADPSNALAHRRYGDALMRARQFDAAYTQYLAAAGNSGDAQALASSVAAAASANRCSIVLPVLRNAASQRANDGRLAQIEVRALASCPLASAEQKSRSLVVAQALYKQNPDSEHAEVLAMALAANGRGDEAVGYEAEAIFDATKRGDVASLAGRRAWLRQFERKLPVSRPWPDGNLLYAPPAMRAATAAAAPSSMPRP